MAFAIGRLAEPGRRLPVPARRDAGFAGAFRKPLAQGVAVIALVGDHPLRGNLPEHGVCVGDVRVVARTQENTDGPPGFLDHGVELGVQPALGGLEGLPALAAGRIACAAMHLYVSGIEKTPPALGRVLYKNEKLGQRWSAAWEPTGFPGQSTAVPQTMDPRFALLADLKEYFTAVPANEGVDMGATAALCDAAWTALSNARQAVADAEAAQSTEMNARRDAVDPLRKRVGGLIS